MRFEHAFHRNLLIKLKTNLVKEVSVDRLGDIWVGRPTLLIAVAEKISNLFWQEIMKTFAILLEAVHYSSIFSMYLIINFSAAKICRFYIFME